MSPDRSLAARCAAHPDLAAEETCARCGVFTCSTCGREGVDEKVYCPSCAHRPDADPVERYRLRMFGQRDFWTWLVGFAGVCFVILAARLAQTDVRDGLFSLIVGVTGGAYFFRLRWARLGLWAAAGLGALVIFNLFWSEEWATRRQFKGALVTIALPVIAALALVRSPRNRLFFRFEVPRAELESAWRSWSRNTLAQVAFGLSVVGCFVPGLGPVGLAFGVVALVRTRAKDEPIDRRGTAIAAIGFGAIGCAVMGTVLWSMFHRQ